MTEQRVRTKVAQRRTRAKVENAETVVESTPVAVDVSSDQRDLVTKVVYAGRPGSVGPEGPQGDPGPQGPQGPTGPPGGYYPHYQNVAASVWTITHNLGGYPAVTVIASDGTEVEGDVNYEDNNTVTVTFAAAFGGIASAVI